MPFPAFCRRAIQPVLVAVIVCAGCRNKESLSQDCLHGDPAACRNACDKGVTGEGGCYQLGLDARRGAGVDFEREEWTEARRLFGRSCDGGLGQGCVLGAEMLEAPYIIGDKPPMKTKLISDAEIAERQRLLSRACNLGSNPACKRLGDVTIGKNTETALAAYTKSCRSSGQPAECNNARKSEVEAFEHYRASCKRGLADACTSLANLVHRVDVPRATRLFYAEGELRGVASVVGGLDEFVRLRAAEARGAAVPHPTNKASPPAGAGSNEAPVDRDAAARSGVAVRLDDVRVDGRIPKTTVERVVRAKLEDLPPCEGLSPHASPARMVIELIVDRTGDVWRVSIPESDAPDALRACVTAALSDLPVPRPVSGFAKVHCVATFGSEKRNGQWSPQGESHGETRK